MRRGDFAVGVGLQVSLSSGMCEKFRRNISMVLTVFRLVASMTVMGDVLHWFDSDGV